MTTFQLDECLNDRKFADRCNAEAGSEAHLGERLRDRVSKANLEQASQFMKEAETHLDEGVQNARLPALTPALVSEQAAYQALLRLRAREFHPAAGRFASRRVV